MDDEKVRLRQALLSLVRGVDTHVSAIRDLVRQNWDSTRDPNHPMNSVFEQIEKIAEELDHLAIQCHEVIQQQDEPPSVSSGIDPDEKIPADYSSPIPSVNLYYVDSSDSP
ncbi:hypothetical protein BS78_02G052300 [Paspalum vaginatum]|nr:hypothetical protein BS78_02G052300 [Paspalum vaginatum]